MDMTETLAVRALLLGERLETRGLERDDRAVDQQFLFGGHGGTSRGRGGQGMAATAMISFSSVFNSSAGIPSRSAKTCSSS